MQKKSFKTNYDFKRLKIALRTDRLFFLLPLPARSPTIRRYILLSLRFSEASSCFKRVSSFRIVWKEIHNLLLTQFKSKLKLNLSKAAKKNALCRGTNQLFITLYSSCLTSRAKCLGFQLSMTGSLVLILKHDECEERVGGYPCTRVTVLGSVVQSTSVSHL